MKSFITYIITIIMLFTSVAGGYPKKTVQPASADDDFVPTVRFMVCSDTHENANDDWKIGRIKSAFDYAYAFAEADENYKNLDAAMFVGDLTDNGTDDQWQIFEEEVKKGIREGTTLLAIAAKNHDGYVGASCLEKLSAITNMDSDFHVVINGYHFIGISRSKNEDEHYGLYQRKWLREQLKEAEADDPDKPIFVCHHEHVMGTVYGSTLFEGWGNLTFKDILSQYPQVVHFSGHSHYPLNDPRSIYQGKFLCVGTGAMSYAEVTYKKDRSIHTDDCNDDAQAWIVEADAQNRIRLTGYDVLSGDILCQYFIPSLTDKSTFAYTTANMVKLSSAPAFGSDAAVSVTKNDDGTYTVTAPEADSTDGRIIFLYRVRVYDTSGDQVSEDYVINNYWKKDTYDTVSFNIEAQSGYRVEVTAENAYYMESAPISASIQ